MPNVPVSRLSRRAALLLSAAIGVAVCANASAVMAAAAIEQAPAFVSAYFKGFVSSCRPEVKGDPDLGKYACACAAAVIADRFSVDELKSLQGKGMEDYDKIHAGTSRMIGVCGAAAKATVGN